LIIAGVVVLADHCAADSPLKYCDLPLLSTSRLVRYHAALKQKWRAARKTSVSAKFIKLVRSVGAKMYARYPSEDTKMFGSLKYRKA
jgi:hypothetical protein